MQLLKQINAFFFVTATLSYSIQFNSIQIFISNTRSIKKKQNRKYEQKLRITGKY